MMRSAGALLGALAVCLTATGAAASTLTVFTGVAPLSDIVARLGGERVEVHTLVPPGRDPHTFEPSPRQLAALERADLYVSAGMPFEAAWIGRFRASLPDLAVLAPAGDAGGDHDHDHHDPAAVHPWTDPIRAIEIARAVAAKLSALDPAGAAAYSRGLKELDATLSSRHRAMAAGLAPVRGRALVVYHPAWGALADRYELNQMAIEARGKPPGARHLATLIRDARRAGACAVFVQPQQSDRAARTVARALGVEVVHLDPLAANLPDNLGRVAETLAATMEGPCPR